MPPFLPRFHRGPSRSLGLKVQRCDAGGVRARIGVVAMQWKLTCPHRYLAAWDAAVAEAGGGVDVNRMVLSSKSFIMHNLSPQLVLRNAALVRVQAP